MSSLHRFGYTEKENRAGMLQASVGSRALEIIEDSEPEREARRRQMKEAQGRAVRADFLAPIEVGGQGNGYDAFISQRVPSASSVASRPLQERSTVDRSSREPYSHSYGMTAEPSANPGNVTASHEAYTASSLMATPSFGDSPIIDSSKSLPSLADVLNLDSPTPQDAIVESDSEQSDRSRPPLSLARFAYRSTSTSHLTRRPSVISLTSSSSSSAREPVRTARVHTLQSRSCPLTDDQMRQVSKCVCCDLAWTTRKTKEMKWDHISKCAKKHSFSAETLKARLDQELLVSESFPKASAKGKRKAKDNVASKDAHDPGTLLEGVILQPKKRKKTVPATVQSVPEAHQIIAERAKGVFAEKPTSVPRADETPKPALLPSELAALLPHVPSPGPDNHVASREVSQEPEDYFPPTTQAFVPSRLGGALRRQVPSSLAPPLLQSRDRDGPSTTLTASSSPSSNTPRPRTPPLSLSDLSISSTKKTTRPSDAASLVDLTSPVGSPSRRLRRRGIPEAVASEIAGGLSDGSRDGQEEDNWEDEGWGADAVLQWTGEISPVSNVSASRSRRGSESPPESPLTVKKSKKRTAQTLGESTAGPKKRGKRTKQAAGEAEANGNEVVEDDSEEVERRLRAMIEGNEELYLRILRYEPLKFDDLLQRAVTAGLPERRLKTRLRAFLDKQCINFYSADPTGPRRRH